MAYALFPLGVGAFVYRDLAVKIVFGAGWEEAEIVVGLWALVSVVRIIFISMTNAVYVSKGIPKIAFYLQIIDIVILIPTCICGVRMGFEWFVVIRCIARIVAIIPNLYFLSRFCGFSAYEIIKNSVSPFLLSGLMGVCAVILKSFVNGNILVDFAVIGVCAAIYCMLLFLFARKELIGIVNRIKSFIKR